MPARPPSLAIEALLRDLGPNLHRGASPTVAPTRCPTGLPGIDRLLDGGFPRGGLSEIAGSVCCGRTSLALALLARTTATGEVVAVVDGADAFDPPSAAAAGVDLSRVLWVRTSEVPDTLRSAEHLLAARGFALVLLDLAPGRQTPARIPSSAWSRLRRTAAGTDTALVVLGDRRMANTFADLAIEMSEANPRFQGTPTLLEGLDGRVQLVRNRMGPHDCAVTVRWQSARAA
jgi:RecA/RadA recombinase